MLDVDLKNIRYYLDGKHFDRLEVSFHPSRKHAIQKLNTKLFNMNEAQFHSVENIVDQISVDSQGQSKQRSRSLSEKNFYDNTVSNLTSTNKAQVNSVDAV